MFKTIKQECTQFIKESNGNPLLKNLSTNKEGFSKIKVRYKNNKKYLLSPSYNFFNKALEAYYQNIAFKAIYSYTLTSILPEENKEPYYIFPINGYKFLYNPLVESSLIQYNEILSVIVSDQLLEVATDIIKNNYYFDNMDSALQHKCEIIIYDIPYFYAIKKSLADEIGYDKIINSIT